MHVSTNNCRLGQAASARQERQREAEARAAAAAREVAEEARLISLAAAGIRLAAVCSTMRSHAIRNFPKKKKKNMRD
eukprot:COSAG05_NODE_7001_length_867_cov_37.853002_2_plen_77_part_00